MNGIDRERQVAEFSVKITIDDSAHVVATLAPQVESGRSRVD